jgi:Carboxylesterase family
MVWFHGGGNRVGAGSTPIYWGENLARKGAVVVSFNYRLGLLGFFAHPELSKESPYGASGNYGLMDMIAVLGWVQNNIEQFGGDPGRVTVFGQSAGAANISCLVASPLSRRLFPRVIGASMGRFKGETQLISLPQAEQIGLEFGKSKSAVTLAELRNLAADQFAQGGRGEIIVDGHVMTELLESSFAAGRHCDVPTNVGFTADEATPYKVPHSAQALKDMAAKHYGERVPEFLKLYPLTPTKSPKSQRCVSIAMATLRGKPGPGHGRRNNTGRHPCTCIISIARRLSLPEPASENSTFRRVLASISSPHRATERITPRIAFTCSTTCSARIGVGRPSITKLQTRCRLFGSISRRTGTQTVRILPIGRSLIRPI